MKVLFCTDGSKISFNALHNFAGWAENATVDVICVIDWSFLPDDVSIETEGFAFSCANIADNILEYAQKEIKNYGLNLGEKIKQCGGAVECILEQLNSCEYDLVVMGSHGKKGIQQWLGSVSRDILYNANTAVYIAKNKNRHTRILFTPDDSENSDFAVTMGLDTLKLSDKEIFICTVTENPDLLFLDGTLDTNWLLAIEQQQEIHAQNLADRLKARIEDKGHPVEKASVLEGNPAQKIIEFAASENIDLIITGTKGQTKMKDFLLGSVSKRVLENTQSDVLIFK